MVSQYYGKKHCFVKGVLYIYSGESWARTVTMLHGEREGHLKNLLSCSAITLESTCAKDWVCNISHSRPRCKLQTASGDGRRYGRCVYKQVARRTHILKWCQQKERVQVMGYEMHPNLATLTIIALNHGHTLTYKNKYPHKLFLTYYIDGCYRSITKEFCKENIANPEFVLPSMRQLDIWDD